MQNETYAPGWPGIEPRWSSSAKVGVSTAIGFRSMVWFTLSHGILNEIYYPRVDWACTRDMGLIVTDGKQYFSEEKRHTRSEVEYLAKGVPAYRLTNTSEDGRYRVVKEILVDPGRDVVLRKTRFEALHGKLGDYHLYVLLSPRLGNRGFNNSAWVGDYKGVPMLFAEREGRAALALASSAPWRNRSASFVGDQDNWHDLAANGELTTLYTRAENGNVELIGEIDLEACGGFILALGFDGHAFAAARQARASCLDGFDDARERYVAEWTGWQGSLLRLEGEHEGAGDHYRVSTAEALAPATVHWSADGWQTVHDLQRALPVSTSTSRTCQPRGSLPERPSGSRSTGRMSIAGRMWISRLR
jgi:glucoamylase